jgi:hypothetical protein
VFHLHTVYFGGDISEELLGLSGFDGCHPEIT